MVIFLISLYFCVSEQEQTFSEIKKEKFFHLPRYLILEGT